uniref:Uncharacterized protein n=1 Tax=Myoviridae sp. ctijX18 TaxID=2825154 RepID=A0A8S5USE2_9CAUD|nr:MAG TPA: hypothetical protein [Myoviridae sp. ctijX18]DAQ61284.1 MAG TPA: hypothetical protein [Caudoviricetes sp.]
MSRFGIKSYLKSVVLEDLKEEIEVLSRMIVKEYRIHVRKHGLSFKVRALDETGFKHGIDIYSTDRKLLFFKEKKLIKSDITTLDFYFEDNKEHLMQTPYEIAKRFGNTAIKALVYSLLNIREMYKSCKVSNPRMLEKCSRYYSLLILWMFYTESGKVEINNIRMWYENFGIPECYFKYSQGIYIDQGLVNTVIGIRGDIDAMGDIIYSVNHIEYK